VPAPAVYRRTTRAPDDVLRASRALLTAASCCCASLGRVASGDALSDVRVVALAAHLLLRRSLGPGRPALVRRQPQLSENLDR
jgi:hypothetical protein